MGKITFLINKQIVEWKAILTCLCFKIYKFAGY
jgi:hypothetical protein